MPETKNQVVPLRSLDEMVFLVHKKFEKVVATQGKFLSARVECGLVLLELRERIEAGEAGNVKWWNWYGERFARSRRDAERVMEIASQENPIKAHEAEKAKNRERQAEYRQRQRPYQERAEPPYKHGQEIGLDRSFKEQFEDRDMSVAKNSAIESSKRPALSLVERAQPEVQHDLIDQAIAVVKQMNITTRHRFVVKLRQIYRD